MAVYRICQHTDCGGRRREHCNEPTSHRRYTGWVADWKPSRKKEHKRLRETFDYDLDNPKEQADDCFRAWKTDWKRNKRGFMDSKGSSSIFFGALADRYWVEHASVEGRKPEKSTFYTVEKLKEWVKADRRVHPLTDEELTEFRNDMRSLQRKLRAEGRTGATVNRIFNILRSIFERSRGWGLIKINPVEFVERMQEDEPAPRFLEQTEINKLFATVDHLVSEYGNPVESDRKERLTEFMTVLSHTGARPSSIAECSFDNGDVDLVNRIIWFTTYKGGKKRKKHRYPVTIDDVLYPLISRRAEATGSRGLVFDCQDMPKLTHQVVEQSGINKGKSDHMRFTIYGLKHCYASQLLMTGASLKVVADLLGHTDTRMVQKHYGHLTMEYLRKAQNKVNLTPALLKVI